MSERDNRRTPSKTARRSRRVWITAAALAALALVALGLFVPWPRHSFVTEDGRTRWRAAWAPPRYEVVWRPAERIELPELTADGESLIQPRLADDGASLYFTLRRADGEADIHVARLVDGEWQTPQPVAELNTPSDDIMGDISPDGAELYFYSDRTGGAGGFDLYVAERDGDSWSEPRNLGPRINTPAHEYAPALAPDRRRLFFSSNRNPRMDDRARRFDPKNRDDVDDSDEWTSTLRASQPLAQFDLYASARDSADDEWPAASPLARINRPDANEGTPAVSPSGAFLYFSSDRPNDDGRRANGRLPSGGGSRSGEANPTRVAASTDSRSPAARNFDLYRARLDGIHASGVQDLGPGVNTSANELDPTLSAEGFRLVYSSDREVSKRAGAESDRATAAADGDLARAGSADSPPYELYSSLAAEVFTETEWRAVGLPFLIEHWRWIVAALLMAALLAALVWYLRQVSMKRASVPTFLLIALIVHLMLGTGMFFVGLGDDVVRIARRALNEVVAFDYAESGTHQSHEAGQQAYEKVADLTSVEAVDTPDVVRQTFDTPNMPVATERLAPMTPTTDPSEIPPELIVVVAPPAPPSPAQQEPMLVRQPRPLLDEMIEPEQVEVAVTQAAESAERAVESVEVATARAPSATTLSEPPLARRMTLPDVDPLAPIADEIPEEPNSAAFPPAPIPADNPLELARANPATLPEFDAPEVATEAMANEPAERSDDRFATPAIAVDVSRSATTDAMKPTLPRSAPAGVEVASSPTAVPLEAESPVAPAAPGSTQADAPMLARATPLAIDPLDALPIEAGEAMAEQASAGDADAAPETSDVAIARRDVLPIAPAAAGPLTDATMTPDARPSPKDDGPLGVQVASLVAPNMIDAAPSLARRIDALDGASAPNPAEAPVELADAPVSMSDAASNAISVATAADVELARRAADLSNVADPAAASKSLAGAMAPSAPRSVEADAEDAIGESVRPDMTEVAANLARTSRAADAVAFAGDGNLEVNGAAPTAASGEAAMNQPVASIDIDVARAAGDLPAAPVKTPDEFGGRFDPARRELVVGSQSDERVDAAPSVTSIASSLARMPARAPLVLYAEDSIGLQAMLRLRQDDGMKRDLLEAFGGNEQTLAAVKRGLSWIERHQFEDGRWSLHQFNQCCKDHAHCDGHGNVASDVAATGFALLPLLGDNHTHRAGQYQTAVDKGVRWLVERQKENGELTAGNEGNARMYSHAVATIALCEAYGMTKDAELEPAARRAVEFIVRAQNRDTGGWRYQPGDRADTSVVGWQMMALKSAQMAGLTVPPDAYQLVSKWLDSVEGQGPNIGRYGYQDRNPKSAMTAEALLCREYLRMSRSEPSLQASADYLLTNLPKAGAETSYYWYYGTQAMFHLQGDYWKQWNGSLRDVLLTTQVADGPKQGTWDPRDSWEQAGGRLYSTSLRLLMLEVYYRHLPLYQVLDEAN